MYHIARRQRRFERRCFLGINKDANVRTDAILLIDHTKAHARVRSIKFTEQLIEGMAIGVHLGGTMGVGAQWPWNSHNMIHGPAYLDSCGLALSTRRRV